MDKKENNKKDFMPKAQVDIMLEGIRSDFKVFGEKLEMMDGRLMNVENKLMSVEDKVEQIDVRLINVENKLVDVESKVEQIDTRLIGVEEKSDLILEDIDILKSRTVDMKNMKAEKEITDNHEKRILKLEKTSLAAA